MKKVKIKFTEQSSCVVAECSIEYEGDNIPTNEDILTENKEIMSKAMQESAMLTLRKKR